MNSLGHASRPARTPTTAKSRRGAPLNRPEPDGPRLPGSPWLLVAFVLLALWLRPLSASAASVSMQLDRAIVGLGESATLTVVVEGGRGDEQPRLATVPGLQFSLAGRSASSRFTIVNGRQSASVDIQYSYSVTPSRIGEYTLGPALVDIAGNRYSSESVVLKVVAANDPEVARRDGLENAAFLSLILPDRPVYVGETFVAEARLHAIGGELKQSAQFQADGFTLGKAHTPGAENNIRTNNRIYSRLRFLQPLTAARSGDLPLQAGNCILDIPIRRQSQFASPLEEMFGGGQRRRFNLATDTIPLKVLPLPRENMPTGFNGAVGDFQVSLAASPTNLQAGDPITLRIAVSGRGNFDSVQLPEQPGWTGFRVYSPNATFDTEDPLGLEGVKRFEQVVTPESPTLTELPPLVFSFFHPDSRSYRTVRTPPVRLQIAPANATPALPAPPPGTAVAAAPAPTNSPPPLAPLKPHLGSMALAQSPALTRPLYLWLAALPPALWLGILAWQRTRQRRAADLESARRAQLEKSIQLGLAQLASLAAARDADTFFAALFRLLQDLVALKSGLPPAAVTEGVLESALPGRGVPPALLERLHTLFQACNQARYTRHGAAGDFASLRAEAESLARAPELR